MAVTIIRPGVTPMTRSFARNLVELFTKEKFIPGEQHPKEPLSFSEDIKMEEHSVMWDEKLMRWAYVKRFYSLPPEEGLCYAAEIYSNSYGWNPVEFHGIMLPGSKDNHLGSTLLNYIND